MRLKKKTLCTWLGILVLVQFFIAVYYNKPDVQNAVMFRPPSWENIVGNNTISTNISKPIPSLYLGNLHGVNVSFSTKRSFIETAAVRDDGFALASYTAKFCKSKPEPTKQQILEMHYTVEEKMRLCPVEKIGSTFWRRVFYLEANNRATKYKTPFDVPAAIAIQNKNKLLPKKNKNETGFSFLFVRNPLSRLLSTFIDKLVAPNPMFWERFGKAAIDLSRGTKGDRKAAGKYYGHDITFTEFVKFAIYTEKVKDDKDAHLMSIKLGCQPCARTYTFIGRMERFKDDAFYVMKMMGLEKAVQAINTTFSDLSDDDAITDTITDPFKWKRQISNYINWEKALNRLWLKLQMRGLISKDIKLDLQGSQIARVTAREFIQLARKAHKDSNPEILKVQKELVKKEAFDSVPLSVLKEFVETFLDDFLMFGYEPYPTKYFYRDEVPTAPSIFFNYSHLN